MHPRVIIRFSCFTLSFTAMAISVISIFSDSSKESVGTSTARVILFGTIPTAISTTVPIVDPPVVHDDTPFIRTETPTSSPVVSALPHTSLFLYTDSPNNDTSERPPSKDPYEVTVSRWRSRVAARSSPPSSPTHDSPPILCQILPAPPGLPHRPAILVLARRPIPVGRPYHTQPNRVRKMLTARKSVRPLPSYRLALRYSKSHSPSDHLLPDDFSSGYSLDYSSNTSSGHSIADSSFDSPDASFAGPSRKRCISHTVLVPLATPVLGALSHVFADLLPPRKRIRGLASATAQDDSTEESYEAYTEPDIDSDVQVDIDADIAVAEATAAREADAKVKADTRIDIVDEVEEKAESSRTGTVEIRVDTVIEPVVSEDTLVPTDDEDSREVHRMLAASQQSAVMSDRIGVLKRDNMRLRAMLCIKRERINSLRRHMAYTQKELRQMRRFCYYNRMEFRMLETYVRRRLGTMPTATRTGMTPDAIEEMIE
ncbi:hypothetical protein Tco_0752718 [Tanacetum coccineum]|uniref:Uncharacterized protein n=1 Tax=Tanacetum coccineum TaxID=301880 RepID=A0ABQ4Z8J9_9ASTR